MTDVDRPAIRDALESADFEQWYRHREERHNARAGNFSRNLPSDPPEPTHHAPHTLLSCHRKQQYREENAPAETHRPAGLFWLGSRIEEDVVLPFLEAVAPESVYVGNDIWVDAPVQTDVGELRVRGLTDPVFATRDGTPLLPTEVKTKRDSSGTGEPATHHRAQLHAYLYGLSEAGNRDLSEGVLVYVSRTELTVRTHRVPFDESFWVDRVVRWMVEQTGFRRDDGIPPADPEHEWECENCEFRIRCGRTDDPVTDAGFDGFVPDHRYPRERVREALDADPTLKLTPTLARTYPDLADDRAVADWVCEACGERYRFGNVASGDANPKTCPACNQKGRYATLRGPVPDTAPIVQDPATD
ncbi:MAG: PD-(D/E)XK nuclease family protein [Halanaeroarchaeum sp.]